jgi:hypothetical protein
MGNDGVEESQRTNRRVHEGPGYFMSNSNTSSMFQSKSAIVWFFGWLRLENPMLWRMG